MPQPHVLLSVASSIDGYIDDTSPERLLLSNDADFDRVDDERAKADAILIGTGAIRADNPRGLVKSSARQNERRERGLPSTPLKITLTRTGNLDPASRFWHTGDGVLVYSSPAGAAKTQERLEGIAGVEVIPLPDLELTAVLEDLGARGVGRLMVEGGGQIHTAFLSNNLADEVHLAIAPVIVGQTSAPRILGPAEYPGGPLHRMHLADTTAIGDIALLKFLPKGV